jgi:hypothetical protein
VVIQAIAIRAVVIQAIAIRGVAIQAIAIWVVDIQAVAIQVVDIAVATTAGITAGTIVDITGITDIATDITGTGTAGGGFPGLE